MPSRIIYTEGDVIGDNGVVYIADSYYKKNSPRKSLFRCKCGKEFTALVSGVKNGDTKSCGCARIGVGNGIYKYGDVINGVKFIKELTPILCNSGVTQRVAMFECSCGSTFRRRIQDIKNSNNPSCGCVIRDILKARNTKHGLSKHPMYKLWKGIRSRCYNKNRWDYIHYGGRGIKMSDEFLNDVVSFIHYLTSIDGYGVDGYSIDRIDNNGNYERGNLRWVSQSIQMSNQRKRINCSSKYVGVKKDNNKWSATVCHKYKDNYIGSFDTPEEAAKARDRFIIENNFPHRLSGLLY